VIRVTSREGRTFGVLLMTFGSPATLDDVPAYLASVRGGRPAAEEVVQEFRRRYEVIGGSPLVRITREQAAAVERRLNDRPVDGERYIVSAGMRHAPPFIGDALVELVEQGTERVAAIILSPQYSPIIMGGYLRAVEAAKKRIGGRAEVTVAGAWHQHPGFLDALAQRVQEALAQFPPERRGDVPVILTAHSMPKPVVDREPHYLEQIQETVRAVVERVGLTPEQWQFAYQSAGHTPEEWLKPDFKELIPGLRAAGHRHVLFVPTQFLADHLEVLYDVDVAARAEAEEHGVEFHRIESLNVMPAFIDALADIARRELGGVDRSLLGSGPLPSGHSPGFPSGRGAGAEIGARGAAQVQNG
jgi:protoporphyrin/coproporphyrin ferrochelatase